MFRCTHDGTLKEMLVFYRPRHPKKMFYQRLTLPIHELENKRQLKCTFMSIDQKEEKEVTLYPNKGSRVEQMLEEAKQVSSRNAILETIMKSTIVNHLFSKNERKKSERYRTIGWNFLTDVTSYP